MRADRVRHPYSAPRVGGDGGRPYGDGHPAGRAAGVRTRNSSVAGFAESCCNGHAPLSKPATGRRCGHVHAVLAGMMMIPRLHGRRKGHLKNKLPQIEEKACILNIAVLY